MNNQNSPFFIAVTRGPLIESSHRIIYAVSDADGKIIASQGDIDRPFYGRSAIKPMLALPLIESGAADALGLDETHLALACASHNGEKRQVDKVVEWLKKMDLDPSYLECGPQAPSFAPSRRDLVVAGLPFGREHNNCSGKHTGFISTAHHLGETIKGYVQYEHPIQQRLLRILEELTGRDLKNVARGVDGCGIPVIAIPTRDHAIAMARMASGHGLTNERAKAAQRLLNAMMREPYFVGGTERYCTDFMQAFPGKAAIKVGAEGVYCAAIPNLGLGICLKAEDGASRAAEIALGRILRNLNVISAEEEKQHPQLFSPILKNWAGTIVGDIHAEATF